jgi:hypothetical protein
MSAYTQQVLGDLRPNGFPRALEIFEGGWNMRGPYHQAGSSAKVEIGISYKVEQERANPHQIATGQ